MSKHFVMKLFKEFVEEAKETTEEYSLSLITNLGGGLAAF